MTASARGALLRSLLEGRILLLDGAMGTMIQRERLAEEDYRGERFRGWERELRGNNDLLNLSRPDAVRDIHLAYFRAGADIGAVTQQHAAHRAVADRERDAQCAVFEAEHFVESGCRKAGDRGNAVADLFHFADMADRNSGRQIVQALQRARKPAPRD